MSFRFLHKHLLLILFLSLMSIANASTNFPQGPWVDLTHSFNKDTVYWPTAEPFELQKVFEGVTPSGYFYSAYQFKSAEHGGTHIDAPFHFAKSGKTVDKLALKQLIGNAVVIDVSQQALKNSDYLISTQDLTNWEKLHNKIPENSIVLLYTGYSAFWPDKEKYLGTAKTGETAVANLHFPGLGPEAAKELIKRKVKAVGIDTASIDYGQSTAFKTHRLFAAKNIPIFENVANINSLPATGAQVIALPMKIEGGSGAPLRIIALLPEKSKQDHSATPTTPPNDKQESK